MKKILIISLFLFGQQAFSEVIPSDQLTGIYKNQGKTNTYKINEVESGLNLVNSILCYLHSLRSEEFVDIFALTTCLSPVLLTLTTALIMLGLFDFLSHKLPLVHTA
jgi:hypothetical protein